MRVSRDTPLSNSELGLYNILDSFVNCPYEGNDNIRYKIDNIYYFRVRYKDEAEPPESGGILELNGEYFNFGLPGSAT
jgi:hypothetical protein